MSAVVHFLNRFLYYPVVLVFALNLLQRKHMKSGMAKRYATLYIGVILLALWGSTFLLLRSSLSDLYLIPIVLALSAVAVCFRRHVFPFRLCCQRCGARLRLREILFFDSNLCSSCDALKED